MLQRYQEIPAGLLELEAQQLADALGGPSLISLPGRKEQTLFVTVLLHGNETTGWLAMREVLKRYQDSELPRPLELFIGNVEAAAKGQRVLPDQIDYNRAWPGTEHPHAVEAKMMEEVEHHAMSRSLFASIDIHNNTGLNPHYGCVNKLEPRFFQLARLFSRTVVYFTKPLGVQSMAMAHHCPAVTVECGKVGDEAGIQHAAEFIDACLNLNEWPVHSPDDVDVYHTTATIKVRGDISIDFGSQSSAELRLREDLERLNFSDLPAGSSLGFCDSGLPLYLVDESGQDVTEQYLRIDNGEICTKATFMPSMFTHDAQVIKQDCLGYVMERFEV